jgi:hypothetical protein
VAGSASAAFDAGLAPCVAASSPAASSPSDSVRGSWAVLQHGMRDARLHQCRDRRVAAQATGRGWSNPADVHNGAN